MHAVKIFEYGFQRLADAFFDRWPRTIPSMDRLRQCKLISHRGDHQALNLKENTLKAFQATADAGVWGIELDIRWTKDKIPVVAHDADLLRLHGDKRPIQALTFKRLQAHHPAIASLEEVVIRFGGRLHLMIEIKQQPWPDLSDQNGRLNRVLAPLVPVADYHILCIHHRTLSGLAFTPPQAKVLIAYRFPGGLSRRVLDNQWGGLCGHYLLMRREVLQRHVRMGQQVGTGFVDSHNCLLREIHRDIDWIFSNKAAQLQCWIDRATAS